MNVEKNFFEHKYIIKYLSTTKTSSDMTVFSANFGTKVNMTQFVCVSGLYSTKALKRNINFKNYTNK